MALAVLLNCTFVIAQTEFDAQKLVLSDINGTARYMSMAGAFGALGGDPSAIKDNPAGLGIYRTSEMSGTLNLLMQNSTSNWKYQTNGVLNNSFGNDNVNKMDFNNFSYIKTIPTFKSENTNSGLLSSNWSFSFNRLKNFERNLTVKSGSSASSMTDYMAYFTGNITGSELESANDPYNNTNIPWISELAYQGFLINEYVDPVTNINSWSSLLNANETVTPSYVVHESGYLDEYSLGWAGNFSNKLYLGATLNLQSIDYNASSQYAETFGNNGGMTLSNNLSTTGAGFNLNVGAIVKPVDMLRLGVSVHSPTFFALTDNSYANLDYFIDNATNGNVSTPTGYNSYTLSSPWKFNVSAAVIIGQKGLISAEYDYDMNSGTTFMDQNGNSQSYADENAGMKNVLKDVQTLKIGGEYKLTDNFSLRAGYANMTAGTNPLADKLMRFNTTRTDTEYFQNNGVNYLTAGFGYREAGWFIDFAYMNKILDETFYAYNTNDVVKLNSNLSAVVPASIKTTNNNFIFTIGLKF